jgi:hypothetical protein
LAKITRQYVFEGMELFTEVLFPFVEKRLESSLTGRWQVEVVRRVSGLKPNANVEVDWDQQGPLKTMMAFWKEAFSMVLGHPERSYVLELLDVHNSFRAMRPSPMTTPNAPWTQSACLIGQRHLND